MARWNHVERRLEAKVVYYGPSLGGKTATLAALHPLLDPDGRTELLSICTPDTRTLLFDLLPYEAGSIAGYDVSIELFAVPGQVPHDTTRRVVLTDADALIFVADSSPARREQNIWSVQNLKMNMRATGLDPKELPILFQLNKRDLSDAAPVEQVAAWLGIEPADGFGSAAAEGRCVLQPFAAACRALAERAAAAEAAATPGSVDAAVFVDEMDKTLARLAARERRHASNGESPAHHTIVLSGNDPSAAAAHAGLALAQRAGRPRKDPTAERLIPGRKEVSDQTLTEDLAEPQYEEALQEELNTIFEEQRRLCHNINNPLTAIMGRAQILQLKQGNDPAVMKVVQVIEESAKRVASDVRELSDLIHRGKRSIGKG